MTWGRRWRDAFAVLIRFIAGSTSQSPTANEACESTNLLRHPFFAFDYFTDIRSSAKNS
jgi:hypothetical protein